MHSKEKRNEFTLAEKETGYSFRFGETNCMPLFFNDDGSKEYTGNMVFDRIDTHEWKKIEMRRESLKSVISMIIAQRDYWLLVGIDFITDTGKVLMFDAGDCVLNFTGKEDLFPCLQRILREEGNLIPLYNLLCENIGDTIIYENGDFRVSQKYVYDPADFNFDVEPETESPFD